MARLWHAAMAALLAAGLAAPSSRPASAQAETVETIPTRPGQSIRVLLRKPAKPIGSVILIAGGHGNLDLSAAGDIGWGKGNQMVRTRADYARAGYVTAVPDIAPDFKRGEGVVDGYRWSKGHADDIGALVKHLRGLAAPVYLVGTSRGALTIGNAATRLSGDQAPDAIVITSGMLAHFDAKHPSVERNVGNVGRIKQPTLIVYHEKDGCSYTPASSGARFKALLTGAKKADLVILKGGSAGSGDPCQAQSYHGFLGMDGEVVSTITQWLQKLQ